VYGRKQLASANKATPAARHPSYCNGGASATRFASPHTSRTNMQSNKLALAVPVTEQMHGRH
jgi:hypothetical protein